MYMQMVRTCIFLNINGCRVIISSSDTRKASVGSGNGGSEGLCSLQNTVTLYSDIHCSSGAPSRKRDTVGTWLEV